MEYRYRKIDTYEEHAAERAIAEKALKVFSKKLGLRGINLFFMVPHETGEILFDESIAGACPPEGDKIFILRGLSRRDLVGAVIHELKHCQQRRSGKTRGKDNRERDARLYEYETSVPREDQVVRWLCELELDQ